MLIQRTTEKQRETITSGKTHEIFGNGFRNGRRTAAMPLIEIVPTPFVRDRVRLFVRPPTQ